MSRPTSPTRGLSISTGIATATAGQGNGNGSGHGHKRELSVSRRRGPVGEGGDESHPNVDTCASGCTFDFTSGCSFDFFTSGCTSGQSFLGRTFKQPRWHMAQPHIADRHYTTDIGDYELVSAVGVVDDISHLYVARHKPSGGALVSLKFTDLSLSADYALLAEAADTARNTRLCRHENILGHHTAFVEQERLWTVTDVLHRGSCKQLMTDHLPHGLAGNETLIATILRDVLKALCYLHEQHIIHSNIRADNIFLDASGQVKLAGFYQMLEMVRGGRRLPSVFRFTGDPEFMAPEVLSQATTFNSKVDIYSLGLTALELFYGRTPFEGWPALKILLCKLQYETPEVQAQTGGGADPPTTTRRPSKNLAAFIDRCLSKNPVRRPSAWQLLAEDPFIRSAKDGAYVRSQFAAKGVRLEGDM